MLQGVQMQFHKDDIVTVTIEDLGASGEGIGHADGFTLFIKDALPGDTVRAKIMKVKKGYGYARLLEIAEPSSYRVPALCPAARPCGGCQVQELSYEKQLEFKYRKVHEDLIRIGGFDGETVDGVMQPVLGMDDPWHFRNKAQFPIGDREGEPVAGFYAARTHHIIPVQDCLIGAPENAPIVRAVLDYMKQYHVFAYDEKTGKGLVRHILIRSGYYSGQIMVCLVINGRRLPEEDRLIEALTGIAGMTSISVSINTQRTNVILGQEIRTLWGSSTITDTLRVLECTPGDAEQGRRDVVFTPEGRETVFSISPLSFYQVNSEQTEKLYSLVRYFAALTGNEVVWDVYCGVGTISCFLAPDAKEVYGVEVIPDAIRDARENARINGLDNVVFEVGKAEDVLPAYVREGGGYCTVDVIVVDPPRKGCDPLCLQTILDVHPKRIVYVSCDPATLARDLKILASGGYGIRMIQPVDMFPHSIHVETVVGLSLFRHP